VAEFAEPEVTAAQAVESAAQVAGFAEPEVTAVRPAHYRHLPN